MLMSSRATVLTFLLAALVATTACSRRDETEPCVATPSFTLGRDRAAIGSPLKLTYGFEMAQNAKIDQDYWVFVHVLDSEGESLWGDDHQPPEPTSKWQPGKRIEYTRTVFVPSYPYIGPAQVRIGEQVIGTFTADSKERKLLTFPITAAQFGAGDMAELVIEADRTFTPGGSDNRELAIRVFHAFVEPR